MAAMWQHGALQICIFI